MRCECELLVDILVVTYNATSKHSSTRANNVSKMVLNLDKGIRVADNNSNTTGVTQIQPRKEERELLTKTMMSNVTLLMQSIRKQVKTSVGHPLIGFSRFGG